MQVVGTAAYIAPEMLRKRYSYGVDIWGLGVTLAALLTGAVPFVGDTETSTFVAVLQEELNVKSSPWDQLSAQALESLTGLLAKNPDVRPSARAVLEHEWFRNPPDRVLSTAAVATLRDMAGETTHDMAGEKTHGVTVSGVQSTKAGHLGYEHQIAGQASCLQSLLCCCGPRSHPYGSAATADPF